MYSSNFEIVELGYVVSGDGAISRVEDFYWVPPRFFQCTTNGNRSDPGEFTGRALECDLGISESRDSGYNGSDFQNPPTCGRG